MAIPEECREIPDDIEFGHTLLLTPTLQEMGMPKAMAGTVRVESVAPLGSWIERGDPLTRITFTHYRFGDDVGLVRKGISRLLGASKTVPFSVTIHSPVSGFCVVVRNAPTRVYEFPSPCFHGLINFSYGLPVLLVPDDEPEWNAYALQAAFRELAAYMTAMWELGVHNLGQCGGYKQVSLARAFAVEDGYNIGTCGAALDVTPEEIAEARQWSARSESVGAIQWPVCSYDDYCACKYSVGDRDSFYDLQDYITEYRSKDGKLRKKLKHLDKKIKKDK